MEKGGRAGGRAWGKASGIPVQPLAKLGIVLAAGLALSACSGATLTGPRPSGGGGGGHARAGHPSYKVGAPYQINGVWYYPKVDYSYEETGVASWYGEQFNQQYTANGEVFDLNDLTAAHRTLPLPSVVEVTNLQNGRSMQLRVNDRGPFAQNRILDVSRRAAQMLGFERSGTTQVRVRILKDESVRVAQAAMRGSTGDVQLAAVSGGAVSGGAVASGAASNGAETAAVAPMRSRRAPERAIALASAAPADPPPYRMTADTEIIASQPRPNPPDRQATPVRMAAAAPMQEEALPARAAPEPLDDEPIAQNPPASLPASPPASPPAPAHRAPWYSPIASAEAEPLPKSFRQSAAADRVVAPAASGRIFVQAGAFSVPENAQRARSRLASLGSVEVAPISVRGVGLYRVRVGPVRSSEEAGRLVTRLMQDGYPDARVVKE